MSAQVRTQGDGREYPEETVIETKRKTQRSTSSAPDSEKIDKLGKQYLSKKIQSSATSIYNPIGQQELVHNFPREVTPKGKKFYLIPKLVPKSSSNLKIKNKNPKLILLEPYRACTSPMVPFKENNNKVKIPKSNKNNLDLNELVRHMNITKTTTTLNDNFNRKISNVGVDENSLRKERDQLESQLKFQMQVNSELKSLLVHCLGEDIQSKVSNLTEDKMKIAEHLSTNTEKIEYLAGQCEVFRSKFLASSLMVEELAK
ncbi:hypothetical protein PVAND_003405 [Polypedilum vanderplanki]|uniref:Uncharacterized protein n=1 Tax=Polypedilum vanderplanki TaxID=319348 RepID=A0A9J6BV04_POLVA|nr:hypothetical protein PVAND_003405 [Polypedilum vanderplanki]